MMKKGLIGAVLGLFAHKVVQDAERELERRQGAVIVEPPARKKYTGIPKGHRAFEIEGVTIHALNEANALRKYHNLRSKGK